MRYGLFSVLMCTALILTNAVQARGYFGIRGGVSEAKETEIVHKRTDAGMGSGYIGAYSGPFRGELEYTFLTNSKYKSQELEARFQRVMGQLYIDVPVTPYVIPYLNGGAGVAFRSVKFQGEKDSGGNFAWNAGAGLGVKLTRNIIADAGFRYVDMGDATVKDHDLHFNSYEGYIGLRLLF